MAFFRGILKNVAVAVAVAWVAVVRVCLAGCGEHFGGRMVKIGAVLMELWRFCGEI
jgi:hypothetical protein